jgi:hypothetical protein
VSDVLQLVGNIQNSQEQARQTEAHGHQLLRNRIFVEGIVVSMVFG